MCAWVTSAPSVLHFCAFILLCYKPLLLVTSSNTCGVYVPSLIAGVPGGYNEQSYSLLPTVAEYIWAQGAVKCNSSVVHQVCIISSADLYQVKYEVDLDNVQGPLFHNKYFMEKDHTVMDCLEEQLVIRNKREYMKECSLRATL